jgi:hypothetical protein
MNFAEIFQYLGGIGVGIICLSGMNSAQAISLHTSDFINDGDRSNFNGFEGLPANQNFGELSSQIYTEDGITVEQVNGDSNGVDTTFTAWGAQGERAWYANGGDSGYTKIVRENNTDFASIGFISRNL